MGKYILRLGMWIEMLCILLRAEIKSYTEKQLESILQGWLYKAQISSSGTYTDEMKAYMHINTFMEIHGIFL